jgi:arylsulfatase A-like enzyme
MSATLAAVPVKRCTSPDLASTPMWAFILKWAHGLRDQWGANSYSHQAFDFAPIPQPKEETQDWKVSDYFAAEFAKKEEQPCFFAAGIFRPHLPWYAPKEFFDMHPLAGIQLPKGTEEDDLDDLPPSALKWADTEDHRVLAGNGKWEDAIRGYLACVSFADACIGHLLDAVDKSPDRDRTIVVIWGDHGWHLGEKMAWQKPRPWERCTKVPLLIRVPGLTQPGSRCARPVSLLDLYPTLAAVCGLPEREGVEGRSIAPLLANPQAEWPYAVVTTIGAGSHSVRDGRWRYMRYANGDAELYDHDSDPNEWVNLAKNPQHTALKASLVKWIPTTNAPAASSGEGAARRKARAAAGSAPRRQPE